jgi:hypothetical protein
VQTKEGLTIKDFYKKYKKTILFNRNILISDVSSLILAALFAQVIYGVTIAGENKNLSNSLLTSLIEYAIETPLFLSLFYISNKSIYIDAITRKPDNHRIRIEMLGLLAAFSISDMSYVIIKIFLQYQLLASTSIMLQPYQAALLSSLIAWGISIVTVNLTMKAKMVFSKNELIWYYVLIMAISISNSVITFSGLDLRLLYDNVVIDVGALLAVGAAIAVLFMQKIKSIIDNNRAFVFIAVGIILWATAELTWTYYQLGLRIENPFPSIADAFWVIGYIFFIPALYSISFNFIKSKIRPVTSGLHTKRKEIVAISAGAAVATGIIYIILSAIFSGQNPFTLTGKGLTGFIISATYPILDVIMLVPAASILWSLKRVDPSYTHWVLICAFVIFNAIADVGFAYAEIINVEAANTQTWVWDTFYNAGYLCLAGALLWYVRFSINTTNTYRDKAVALP